MQSNQLASANFSALVVSIAHSAILAMGLGDDKSQKNRTLAEFNIDLLLVLKEKTKNNLLGEEQRLLDQVIADLQLKFLQTKE